MNSDLHSALHAYEQIVRAVPHDIHALCAVGKRLHQFNRPQETRKCYKAAVELLQRAIRAGDANAALYIEHMIVIHFVRTIEDENHYYRCFADWRDDLAKLGRRLRNTEGPRGDPRRIAFFLHTGYILGHTDVLFKMLENVPADRRAAIVPRIYVLEKYAHDFMARAQRLGIEVILIEDLVPAGNAVNFLEKFLYLRDRLRQDDMGVCVWVSAPAAAAFALSMRLAPVQIFWALRFHPVTCPAIDGYITYGARDEQERVFGKQKWRVCPVPLAIEAAASAQAGEITQLRARFPEPVLLGTLSREEKIDSEPFLKSVASILINNPQAGYLWTGRTEHPRIRKFFEQAGVAQRCHYVGWVDTRFYVAALDIFLETFPLGCGVTGYQALSAGVPLLSILEKNTVFGMQFWHRIMPHGRTGAAPGPPPATNLGEFPILCARDMDDYVALAGRLISDAEFRAAVGARGQTFFQEELANGAADSNRFFDTIRAIADTTPGTGRSASAANATQTSA